MSADNGIYILETAGPEYRVAEHMAIENLFWDENLGEVAEPPDENMLSMFGRCRTFTNKAKAFEEADRLLQETYICEYGIQFLRFKHRKFPEQ